jgi:Ca2+-transporting ATPase
MSEKRSELTTKLIVGHKRDGRSVYSKDGKRELVEACLRPGMSVARLALQHDFDFQFLGLIGFADPLRPSVPAAIKESYAAGIRVVMITGDYPATAMHIAEQAGLVSKGGYIAGSELETMSDAELQRRIKEVNVFCRVVPEQKLRLVKALKANSEIVAMTGDGVNDAPALKAAHIGIAMGERGTDVAREAAALVLLTISHPSWGGQIG